jgi:hypothetical protein
VKHSKQVQWTLLWLAGWSGTACGGEVTAPLSGSLEVTSVTSGDSADANGYTLTLDGQRHSLGPVSVLTFSDLSPGDHQLELGDVAANCAIGGDNPRVATIPADGLARISFDVQCSTPPGSIDLTITTSGENLDPDGYAVILNGWAAETLGTNSSFTWSGVGAGDRSLLVDGIAADCALSGPNPHPVTVAGEAAAVGLEIICAAPAGTLAVTTSTTGLRPDLDGYTVQIDGGSPYSVATNSTLSLPNISIGDHQVTLGGVAENCALQTSNPTSVTVAYHLTSQVVFDIACHFNATAGLLLFTGEKSGETHVFRINADGSGVRDLTPNAEGEGADWSPDRKRVVFVSTRHGANALFVMNADGSGVKRLRDGVGPAWSPDGRTIAFVDRGTIMLMDADGSNARSFDAGSSPSWSPDGSAIAFVRVDVSRCFIDFFCPSEIFVKQLDGSAARRLTASVSPSDQAGGPVWSPDGTTIVYSRVCCFLGDHLNGLWVIGAGGGISTRITSDLASEPVWSPDGSAIVYAGSTSGGDTELTVVPAGGSNPVVLLSRSGSEYPTSWR